MRKPHATRTTARAMRVHYLGVQDDPRGGKLFLYNDMLTGTSFSVRVGESVLDAQQRVWDRWKVKPRKLRACQMKSAAKARRFKH